MTCLPRRRGICLLTHPLGGRVHSETCREMWKHTHTCAGELEEQPQISHLHMGFCTHTPQCSHSHTRKFIHTCAHTRQCSHSPRLPACHTRVKGAHRTVAEADTHTVKQVTLLVTQAKFQKQSCPELSSETARQQGGHESRLQPTISGFTSPLGYLPAMQHTLGGLRHAWRHMETLTASFKHHPPSPHTHTSPNKLHYANKETEAWGPKSSLSKAALGLR